MKRIIKFRAWDNVDYMSTPFTLQDVQNKKIEFTSDCVIMQFTGLLDKNGKEIYEGDLITSSEFSIQEDENGDYVQDEKGNYVTLRYEVKIEWMEIDAFEVYGWNIWGFYDNPLGKRIQSEIEVIGNIFENPELIK